MGLILGGKMAGYLSTDKLESEEAVTCESFNSALPWNAAEDSTVNLLTFTRKLSRIGTRRYKLSMGSPWVATS